MRFDADAARELARRQGLTLSEVLRRAGVSRTAFYSLARRRRVVPRTVTAVARVLGLPTARLLRETQDTTRERAEDLAREARRIHARSKGSDFTNLWHTLNLLELAPAERLARSLARGRARPLHR
jgi:transcriptional regulator with XRE-family HTH domain